MSRAHARPQHARRRMVWIGLISAGALTGLAVAALAATGNDEPAAAPQAIVCPSPLSALSAVPAAAQAEVTRELANLDKQIAEANTRLANSVGQGGPDFVQNAILGPLADKRTAALDRIAIAIGRVADRPQGLAQFATCQLGGAAEVPTETSPANTTAPGTEVTQAPADGQIACPSPVGALPEIPAAAQAEVTRELENLDKQIAEANNRLVSTAGQGGPAFVQNAILGPLADKRTAALNRIETAIGRVAAKPEGLERFATCALS
jgi:flagellar motility protein MotE (MotC chaperone)